MVASKKLRQATYVVANPLLVEHPVVRLLLVGGYWLATRDQPNLVAELQATNYHEKITVGGVFLKAQKKAELVQDKIILRTHLPELLLG